MHPTANYFDHAASTPVLPQVLEAMLPWLGEACGNEHSAHAWGRQAREACEEARAEVAGLLGAEDPSQVVFTSGATEANNAVVAMFHRFRASEFEHSSVRLPAEAAETGMGPALACQMAVSNETGEWFFPQGPPALTEPGEPLLVDATAAVGKVPFQVGEADYVSLSGHKMGAPKGVGALYLRDPAAFHPSLLGGGHERGLRAGTLNVPGIVGLGVAARLARQCLDSHRAHAAAVRTEVKMAIAGQAGLRVNEAEHQSPFVLSVTCFGLAAQVVVTEVDNLGFGISAGAACGSHNPQPSRAHLARGMTPGESLGTVRLSFGPQNTIESARGVGKALVRAVEGLAR